MMRALNTLLRPEIEIRNHLPQLIDQIKSLGDHSQGAINMGGEGQVSNTPSNLTCQKSATPQVI